MARGSRRWSSPPSRRAASVISPASSSCRMRGYLGQSWGCSGEWSDPTLVLDGARGEYVMLSALGGGVALRDDPDDAAYNSATTAQGIIAAEFAKRASYLALDSDLSAVLPDNPANTFTPIYDG